MIDQQYLRQVIFGEDKRSRTSAIDMKDLCECVQTISEGKSIGQRIKWMNTTRQLSSYFIQYYLINGAGALAVLSCCLSWQLSR